MSRATAKNKQTKQDDNFFKGIILLLAHKIKQNYGNRKVCQSDKQVGGYMQPNQRRLPEITMSMRNILSRQKQIIKLKIVGNFKSDEILSKRAVA